MLNDGEMSQTQLARELGMTSANLVYYRKKLGITPRRGRGRLCLYSAEQVRQIKEHLASAPRRRREARPRRAARPAPPASKPAPAPAPPPAPAPAPEPEPPQPPSVSLLEMDPLLEEAPPLRKPQRFVGRPAVPNGDSLLRGVKRKRAVRWLRDGFRVEVVQRTLRLTDAQLRDALDESKGPLK